VCGGTGIAPWHPQTRATWAEYWASPMATEWIEADVPKLIRLIVLVEDFWRAYTARDRKDLEGEIRLQETCFGLDPVARRRLEWELEKPEEEEKPPSPGPPVVDPRLTLRIAR
jgi:hypothetical protein